MQGGIFLRRIQKLHIAGVVFSIIAGTLLHFVYEWFGGPVFSVLGAVNESTWEHLKLLVWPFLGFGVLEFLVYGKQTKSFFPAKSIGILSGMLTIIIIFYTYTGVLGFHLLAVDIAVFVIGVLVAYGQSFRMLSKGQECPPSGMGILISAAFLGLLVVLFVVFTYAAPPIGLFADPATGNYGL